LSQESDSAVAGRVPTRIAAFWGLGTFGTTTILNGIAVALLFYLVTYLKIEPVVAGGMLFVAKLLDVFVSPPMGLLSDRTRSRFGRRRPYLLGGSFLCGLAFALLFNVPAAASGAGVYVWVAFALMLYVVAYTAFQVPYMAMPAEMTDDYHERSRIMTYRVVFLTLGNMMGVAGCPGLVSAFGADRAAYGKMGWVVGAVVAATLLLTFLGTRGARERAAQARTLAWRSHLRSLLANRPLLVMLAVMVCVYAGISAFTAVMLFFINSVLKKPPALLAVFGLANAAGTLLFVPLQLWVSRHLEKRTAYCVSLTGAATVMLTWLASGPGEGTAAFALRAFAMGACSAGLFLNSNSMTVDAFAYDYRISGVHREGLLAATVSFVEKISLAFGPLVIGALLSAMGFDKDLPTTADQSPDAVRAMYIGFLWIPFASQVASFVLMQFYPLTRRDFEAPAGAEPARAG
jgi:GPH family glycoside/pentoside/hexuronide:cation symporter